MRGKRNCLNWYRILNYESYLHSEGKRYMGKSKKIFVAFNKSLSEDQSISERERKRFESELVRADKIFKSLSSNDFLTEFEMNLNKAKTENNIEEIIIKTVNIITKQIKQMKIRNEIESITLRIEKYEYPFPPTITISTSSDEIEMETELIKPKELHYEFDAISADYNLINANNVEIILETYNKIISKLDQYNWKKICKTSVGFEVKLVQP
jgi:hypothetical protein